MLAAIFVKVTRHIYYVLIELDAQGFRFVMLELAIRLL